MRKVILMMLYLCPIFAQADIYKSVAANGQVIYSSKPSKEAIKIFDLDAANLHELTNINKTLKQHYNNMTGMLKEYRGSDSEIGLFRVYEESVLELMLELKSLIDIKALSLVMKNSEDMSHVDELFAEHNAAVKSSCTFTIERLNSYLLGFESHALLSEAEHTRDDVVKGCDIVQHWK